MKKLLVLVAVIATVAGFTMTASAAEWNFYGSARVSTFVEDSDGNDFLISHSGPDPINDEDTDLTHVLQSNARIGAEVKVSDQLSGRFEYGTGTNLRLLYGTWHFGAGEFTVGQFYSPLNMFYSNQVFASDENLTSYGGVYSGRNQGLQFKFGEFKIAFLSPSTTTIAGVPTDIDTSLPKIEASYHLDFGNAFIDFAAGYNTFKLETAAGDFDVDCYLIAFGAGITFDNFYANSNLFFGQNAGPYGISHSVDSKPVIFNNDLLDNDAWGFIVVLGAKLNDTFSIETGYGYTEAELDTNCCDPDDASCWYVQATVNLAPGVFIVPEIGFIDRKGNAVGYDEPETMYYGLKWQINF